MSLKSLFTKEKHFPAHIVCVDGVVENGMGEVLLVHNAYKGIWTCPGGQVKFGETLTEALQREIREETGIEVAVGRLICISSQTVTYSGFNGYKTVPTQVIHGFICRYVSGELQTSDETDCVKWVPKEKLLDYITKPTLVERIQPYLHPMASVRYLAYQNKPTYALLEKRDC
jgi:ADP-ribose pyrophosphatase YjhB (NUDIX family)